MRKFIPWVGLGLIGACSGRECEPVTKAPVDEVCVPARAAAATPIAIEARHACGGCGAPVFDACTVEREGATLTVSFSGTQCTLEDRECPAICVVNDLPCTIPALSPGRYTLTGLSRAATSTANLAFEVVAAGGATTCALDFP